MKITSITLSVFFLLNLFACKKDGPTQPIESTWTEEVPTVLAFGRNDVESLQFGSTIFKLKLNCYSDVPTSPCEPQTYKWKEYVTGTFRFTTDSLFFEGDYTDSKFKVKSKECHREGKYKRAYKYIRPDNETLILDPNNAPYYTIRLKKIN